MEQVIQDGKNYKESLELARAKGFREGVEASAKVAERYYEPCMETTDEDALVQIIAEAIRSLTQTEEG